MKLILQIAVGILIALGVVYTGKLAITYYVAHEAKLALEETRAQQEREREVARLAAQKRSRLAKEKKEMRDKREAAFNKAWLAYYIPPFGCDTYRSDAHMVECINHKMRAKAEFTKSYNSGALNNT